MNRSLAFLIACLLLATFSVSPALAEVQAVAEWTFDKPEDTLGWTGGGGVKGLTVRDGCLVGRTIARDPLIHGPMIDIPAKPNQLVEIRMKCSADGSGELFWANTTEPPYEGFRPEKLYQIRYKAGDFRVYRVLPFWQAEKRIIRLRLDPPENAEFAVDYIKVVEIVSPTADRAYFDFSKADEKWFPATDPTAVSVDAVGYAVRDAETLFVSPGIDINASDYPWLSMSARSHQVGHVVLQWVTDDLPGVRSYTVRLKADGRNHVYNVPTESIPDWSGRIRMFALKVPPTGRGQVVVGSVGASENPMGRAEIDIRRFGFRDAVNRVGNPALVQAEIANTGGESASGIKVSLSLPRWRRAEVGDRIRTTGNARVPIVADGRVRTIESLAPGESRLLTWQVIPKSTGDFDARVYLSGDGSILPAGTATLHCYPAVKTEKASYVPEPKPVRGEFEVGMYYYPGWPTYTKWSVLDDFPERRPILGYYREGDPEVADWHIKWMVEHGVTFIVYDWYWSQGGRHLEHAIHQGFFNAKYRDKIKFCLLWANHNPPGTSSAGDMVKVTDYWLDNYFLRDDYMKVDGKPVVVIFSPSRLTHDMGTDAVKAAFEKSREMAKARGLNGIYFVACSYPGRGGLEAIEKSGYDAVSGYNYPSAGDNGQLVAPYYDMVNGYVDFWNRIQDNTSLPYIPVTEPGWDARPWHGPSTRVRTGKTPALFGWMLREARVFVQKREVRGPKMVLIEAWNEFGEGDYVEPHQEWGFGHLDEIRETFTSAPREHVDLIPQDVGLGPYELEKPVPATAWEFDDPKHPAWDAIQNLTSGRVQNGCLMAESNGPDPAIYGEATDVDSRRFRAAEIRMKVDKGRGAQLFWAGNPGGFSEATSVRWDITADGEFHVYTLDLGSSPAWKGRIRAFRLDPCDAPQADIEIDYIRLSPE